MTEQEQKQSNTLAELQVLATRIDEGWLELVLADTRRFIALSSDQHPDLPIAKSAVPCLVAVRKLARLVKQHQRVIGDTDKRKEGAK